VTSPGRAVRSMPSSMRYCEALTRRRARNFWYGIRLLPPAKRHALAAVYALARRVDDVGDGTWPADEKRARLDRILASLERIDPTSPDPVLAALGLVRRDFPIPVMAFRDLIEGVRMDVDGATYETFDDLAVYCRRVAGSIGRLSLAVFGSNRMDEAVPLADDLGVAMQITNILRDVREDVASGRFYVPAEDMARFACSRSDLRGPASPQAEALIGYQVARARSWFARGMRLLSLLDRRSAACAGAMAGIYTRLLDQIEARPGEVLDRQISLPSWEKAWAGALAILRRGRPPNRATRGTMPAGLRGEAA
jgi:phytoene synthase